MILTDVLKLLQAIYSIQIQLESPKTTDVTSYFFFRSSLVIFNQVYLMNTTVCFVL